jgi:hypothetical protein
MQFFDANGEPLAGGLVYFYIAGTSTPADTFAQADLDAGSTNPNPVVLDADGRPPDPIFIQAIAYKVAVHDADDVLMWTVDEWSDPGYIFAETYGTLQTEGPGAAVTTGYQVLVTDRYVPVDSTGNPTVLLPSAADYGGMLIVKLTTGAGTCAVTPDGSDTIDGIAAAFTMAASASPIFSTLVLISNGVGAWTVVAYTRP